MPRVRTGIGTRSVPLTDPFAGRNGAERRAQGRPALDSHTRLDARPRDGQLAFAGSMEVLKQRGEGGAGGSRGRARHQQRSSSQTTSPGVSPEDCPSLFRPSEWRAAIASRFDGTPTPRDEQPSRQITCPDGVLRIRSHVGSLLCRCRPPTLRSATSRPSPPTSRLSPLPPSSSSSPVLP